MLKNCWAIAATLLFLCGFAPGVAYAASSSASPYVVDVWEKDLPASSVLSVIQTHEGYLWMGTLHGLVRFDGIHFKSFGEADGLTSARVVHLFEDSRSNLWVGTESAGITLIRRTGEITNLPIGQGIPSGQLASACEDTNGTI